MSKIKSFPSGKQNTEYNPAEFALIEGADLRDYFAIRVLPTVMEAWGNNDPESWDHRREEMCRVAYNFADAMMKVR